MSEDRGEHVADAAERSIERDFELFALARAGFKRRLELVGADDWTRRTPCTEWDVRQLVNHVVGSDLRYAALLKGMRAADYRRRREGETGSDPVLGSDPLGDWERSGAAFETALREPGGFERIVDYPRGPRRGLDLLAGRIMDITIHTWDLARSLDTDDILDERLVRRCLSDPIFRDRIEGSDPDQASVLEPADLQRLLIEASGRRESWTSSD